MTSRSLTREEVRAIDRMAVEKLGMSSLVLMENAGRGAAEVIQHLHTSGSLLILCGLGNNGGDGFVIARHWDLLEGARAIVAVVAPIGVDIESAMSADALANFNILRRTGHPIIQFATGTETEVVKQIEAAEIIVDAFVGTGARGRLRAPMDLVVRRANSVSALRVAIDIPSGLDCDTGVAHDPTFRADHTITFVAPKVGFDKGDAARYIGDLHVVGIGVPLQLYQ